MSRRSTKSASSSSPATNPEPQDVGRVSVDDGFQDPEYDFARVDVLGRSVSLLVGYPNRGGMEFEEAIMLSKAHMERVAEGGRRYTGFCQAFAETIGLPLEEATISFTWYPQS